jgi:ribosomal peptide maturation radical SAM protein 1
VTQTKDGAPEVCFVSMPYAEIQRPSLALSLLQGVLAQDGISAQVVHANLWFADKVGARTFRMGSDAPTTYLVGEWTFAESAFREQCDPARDAQYLRLLAAAIGGPGGPEGAADGIEKIKGLRKLATEFIEEAALRVLETGARVIGCTSTFEQHVASLALLRRIKELDPTVVTMMGGANCETVMGEATHRCFPWVDYVVSGEADGLISGLCRLALDRGRDAEAAELPPGVLGPCHRSAGYPVGDRRVPRALFRDLDSLPTPHYDDYFDTLAHSAVGSSITPGLPLETSRGCWWGDKHQCTFCGLNGSSLAFRSKSADKVLEEIESLRERHGISSFEVVDNILDMRYFTTLLPRLAEDRRGLELFYEVKANLSHQQLELMARAGIVWIQPGIESLHTEVLHLMDKGVTGWQNVQLLKWSRELGIRLSWSVLWGFPGEKDEYYTEMAQWMPFLEHLQAPAGVTHLRYDRYSVYHSQAQQMGLILFPIPAMHYVYPVGRGELDQLAYFFTAVPGHADLDTHGHAADGSLPEGVAAMHAAVDRWRSAFQTRRRPMLSMTDQDGVLDVVDTRSCATETFRTLRDLDRAVLLACDNAPRPDRLPELVERDYGIRAEAAEVAETVARLVRDGLILRMDDRLVGLAMQGAGAPMPSENTFPGGRLRLPELQQA